VLQVLADRIALQHNLNAGFLQDIAAPDTGKLEDMRRADGAGGEDDLPLAPDCARAALLDQFHAAGGKVLDQETTDMGAGLDGEVPALPCRLEKSLGRVPANSTALVDLEIGRAFVVATVEVVHARNAGSLRRGLEGIEDIPAHAGFLHAPLSAGAMHVVGAAVIILRLPEVGQDVVPAPAGAAHLPPEIIVPSLAAHIDHAVDRRAAAEHLAARITQ